MRKTRSSAKEPPITISEEGGIRYLHFGNEWIQGALNLRAPWKLALDYSRHMMAWLLFHEEPARLLQLGLGAGSLTHFAHHYFDATETTVVENSEAVLRAARMQFQLPEEDERLEVVISDGEEFVSQPHRHGLFNVLQVDVFDAQVRGPVLDSQHFYDACRSVLAPRGVMAVNLFGQVNSYEENRSRIAAAFDNNYLLLPPVEAGNIILLASTAPFNLDWPALYERASEIESRYELQAIGWVNGLKDGLKDELQSGA